MKVTKKYSLFGAVLLLAIPFSAYSMKRSLELPSSHLSPELFESEAERQIGMILLGEEPVKALLQSRSQEPSIFVAFPEDILSEIIAFLSVSVNAPSLEITAKAINSLAQVDKKLNTLINKPEFNQALVAYLAKKFNISQAAVCIVLQTKEAKIFLAKQLLEKVQNHDWFSIRQIFSQVASLDKSIEILKVLAAANTLFYDMFHNNRLFVENIVRIFAELFKVSHLLVCKELNTQESLAYCMKLIEEGLYKTCGPLRLPGFNIVSQMYKAKIDINQSNEQGITALMMAMEKKCLSSIVDFMKYFVFIIDVDLKNVKGDTALMIGVRNNFLEGVQYLISKGADVTITNNDGQTALMIAEDLPRGVMRNKMIKSIKSALEKQRQKYRKWAEHYEIQNQKMLREQDEISKQWQIDLAIRNLWPLVQQEIKEQQHFIQLHQLHQISQSSFQRELIDQLRKQLQQQEQQLKRGTSGSQKLSLNELLQLQEQLREQRKIIDQLKQQL